MSKLSEWKLAQKIQASGTRGIIIGLAVAALVCLVVAVVIIKSRWIRNCMRNHFGRFGKGDLLDLNDGGDDEGCCYTSDKDFV